MQDVQKHVISPTKPFSGNILTFCNILFFFTNQKSPIARKLYLKLLKILVSLMLYVFVLATLNVHVHVFKVHNFFLSSRNINIWLLL